jgi:ATP-dependent DNA helicase RecG
MQLETSVSTIKGVGSKTAEQFQAAGISTLQDLIYFLPRTYTDFSEVTTVTSMAPGHVTLRAKVESVTKKRVRRGLHITEAVLADKTGRTRALWFNQPYRGDQLNQGETFFVSGEYGFQRDRYLILNPSVEKVTDLPVQTGRILPVYRELKGLKSHQLRKILRTIEPLIRMLPENLPQELIKKERLLPLADALASLHFPAKLEDIEHGRERLAYEELLILQLASLLNKQDNAKLKSWEIPFNEAAAKKFVSELPFKLTNAQRIAAWEIVKNLEAGEPMNRLLQGDVGAGKTVVAGMAAFLAANAGYQTAIMAPTEILANQHAETLRKLLAPFNVEVGLLIGGMKPAAKKTLKEQVKKGAVAVVVGTHALIQDDTEFHKLGFVVIDEQHRFGVKQRQQLLQKSKRMPHLLSMTATPIPRSLALTIYGELDISVLNELPKGRKPITTEIHSPNSRVQLYASIDKQIAAGRQVYVICPIITDNGELNELKSVTAEHQRLQNSIFKHRKIGLLHGKLKSDEKESVMRDFAQGKTDILVSTTVVEVGVDVPNATVMLIEGADRFGLAQLHQLRGRVGRSEHQSYCYLVPASSQQPSRRLRELERSGDGFYLAEVDLQLRGPGEIYGRAQHGKLDLRVATLGDTRLIRRTRSAAQALLKSNFNLLQYEQLAKRVAYYRRLTTLN